MEIVTHEPVVALTGVVLPLVIGIGLSILARVLLRRPRQERGQTPFDDTPAPLTKRGSPMPYVIGRRMVAPVFAFAGDRRVEIIKEEVGGKGGGGQEVEKERIYREDGWHILNHGLPGQGLFRILDGERTVWTGDLNPGNTPSGTLISTSNDGDFRVHWGGALGSSDGKISRALDVASNWPHIFYIVWSPKERSNSASWPNYKYEIETGWDDPPLGNGSVFTSSPRGLNPGQAVYGLLTSESPIGAGIDERFINKDSFNILNQCFSQPVNGKWSSGDTVASIIDDILGDLSFALIIREGQLTVISIKDGGVSAIIPETLFEGRAPQLSRIALEDRSTPLTFSFSDASINFEPNGIYIPHDGVFNDAGTASPETVQLPTVTDDATASTVANREAPRRQNRLSSIKVRLVRGASRLVVGQVANISTLGVFRIQKKSRDLEFGAEFEMIEDVSNLGLATDGDAGTPTLPDALTAENDLRILAVQPSGGEETLRIFRVRANGSIVAAAIKVAISGSVFHDGGRQDTPATGGDLEDDWDRRAAWVASTSYALDDIVRDTSGAEPLVFKATAAGTSGSTEPTWPTTIGGTVTDGGVTWTAQLDPDGPVFAPLNGDEQWTDLTGDDASVVGGFQLAIIDDAEAVYFRNVDAVAESDWAASTVYAVGDFVIPTGASTGFRYEAASGADVWQASTAYAVGDLAEPTTPNGFAFRTTVAGTTGSSEPTWPTTNGNTVTDGGVTWEAETAYESGGTEPAWPTSLGDTVVDNHVEWTAVRFALQLKDVYRAQQGTTQADHADGVNLFLNQSQALRVIDAPGLDSGVTATVKSQVSNASGVSDIINAPTDSVTLT